MGYELPTGHVTQSEGAARFEETDRAHVRCRAMDVRRGTLCDVHICVS